MASKTARRSSVAMGKNPTPEQIVASSATSQINRLTPLNGGRHCYLANPLTGRNTHLATNSEEFRAVVAELSALGLGSRLRSEMASFAEKYPDSEWAKVLDSVSDVLDVVGETSDI